MGKRFNRKESKMSNKKRKQRRRRLAKKLSEKPEGFDGVYYSQRVKKPEDANRIHNILKDRERKQRINKRRQTALT